MEEKKKIIDIFSINKSKRVLVWFTEAVITFFFAYIFMHAMVTPLYSFIGHYQDKADEATTAVKRRNELLKNADLLYFENFDGQGDEIAYGLNYTYKLFMGDFVLGTSEEHNVFKRYYENYAPTNEYYSLFKYYDEDLGLFTFNDSSKDIKLKDEYKNAFNALVDPADTMSKDAQKIYDKHLNKFFLTYYSKIMNDMNENNIVLSGISYSYLQKSIDIANQFFDTMIMVSSFISYGLGFVVSSIIIPLSNRNKRSISMIMMKIQRVSFNEFRVLKWKRILVCAFYNFLMYAFVISFLPLPLFTFSYLFSMPLIIYPPLVSLGLCLFSLITLLINGSNRSSSDLLTNTFFISNETLDDIYTAKGYKL